MTLSRGVRTVIAVVALLALFAGGTAEAKKKRKVTRTFSSGDLALPIKDAVDSHENSNTYVPLHIPRSGTVRDVDVSVRLSMTGPNGKLIYFFVDVAPPGNLDQGVYDDQQPLWDGRRNAYTAANGQPADLGSGPNSCAGTPTVFNQSAPVSIDSAPPPFTGEWRPTELPFSGLDLLAGHSLKGTWHLILSDTVPNSVATLGCWSLKIKYVKGKKKKKKKK
jgi:subtilisin-like proprotein convertase family protein